MMYDGIRHFIVLIVCSVLLYKAKYNIPFTNHTGLYTLRVISLSVVLYYSVPSAYRLYIIRLSFQNSKTDFENGRILVGYV